jgi:hypothetical protein
MSYRGARFTDEDLASAATMARAAGIFAARSAFAERRAACPAARCLADADHDHSRVMRIRNTSQVSARVG